MLRISHSFSVILTGLLAVGFLSAANNIAYAQSPDAQITQPPQAETSAPAASSNKEKNKYSREPFVIEHFVTRAVFQNDGTGRTDLEMTVNVLSESGVQQFSQLVFGYNSDNQKVEVISVAVRKSGSSEFSPASAVRDIAPLAAGGAPAYSAYREKHVSVPGLRPGDTLAYRIARITTAPLAQGQFWFEHDFAQDAIVLDEQLEIAVPRERAVKLKTRPGLDPAISENGDTRVYLWKFAQLQSPPPDTKKISSGQKTPAVQMTTFKSWDEVGRWYIPLQQTGATPDAAIRAKAAESTRGRSTDIEKIRALYDFAATKIRTVSLELGVGSYTPHTASEILANEYGDPKDKHTLLEALLNAEGIAAYPVLVASVRELDSDVPSPGQFNHVITAIPRGPDTKNWIWLDTSTEVAPFRMLAAALRGKRALVIPIGAPDGPSAMNTPRLIKTPADPPSVQQQVIDVTGQVDRLGKLTAHVHYSMTGDNALGLRVTFRRTPQGDFKRIGQMLSAGDGFLGDVTGVKSSEPTETHKPFEVDYQISQSNFADWSRKSLQLRLPLPALGIPEIEDAGQSPARPLKLGSPLEVHVRATIDLPAGYLPRAPVPVSIARDYATYISSYSVKGNMIVARRDIAFRRREIPVDLLPDYSAFVRAARADEAQLVSIDVSQIQNEK
jgi:hypothetical protein